MYVRGTGLLWLPNRSWIFEGFIRSPFLLSSYLATPTLYSLLLSWQSDNCPPPFPYLFLFLLSVLCCTKIFGPSPPAGEGGWGWSQIIRQQISLLFFSYSCPIVYINQPPVKDKKYKKYRSWDGILGNLLLHGIQSPFYWRILKKRISFSGIKNTYKKMPVQKTRVYSWIAF